MVQVNGGDAVMPEYLTIGQLARLAGVPLSTIRFWERKGLMSPSAWRSGQRRYTRDDVHHVAFLRLCQSAGFTLAEIARMKDERTHAPGQWRVLVADKLADVQRRIAELDHARDLLTHALRCRHDDIGTCPKFQAVIRGKA